MGYVELSGTQPETAQQLLQQVLDLPQVVTMIVLGLDHETVANDAKAVASHSPSTWWVVWVQNPEQLLTKTQRETLTAGDPANVVCTLSRSDQPREQLTAEQASSKNRLLYSFVLAGTAEPSDGDDAEAEPLDAGEGE